MAQWHALRVLTFDREIRRFLTGERALALAPWANLIPMIRKLRMPIVEVRFGG